MPFAFELRSRARNQMGNNIFSEKWLMLLAVSFVASLIISFAGSFSVLLLVVWGPIMLGYSAICLRQVRNNAEKVSFEELFYGFKGERFTQALVLGLLQQLYIFLWTCLFIIPGIVKSYSYAMVYYIQLDNPNMTATECITESRRLMNGYKWRLFCLDLSFIGWILLCFVTFSIGTLWVTPYMDLSRANFYDELIRQPREDTIDNLKR